jgi:glycine/D-amino acid oxidase-like deaminating enzyme
MRRPGPEPPDLGRSWWLREALALPEFAGPETPPLSGETAADVVILGGGYTGMWTAWFLKEREPSIDVVLLEADICGGGPSGRNGGFCDGWWGHIVDLVATFGRAAAVELLETVQRSPAEIGAFCEEHGIDAWFRMGGDMAVASAPAQDGRWARTLQIADEVGVRHRYHELTREEIRSRCDAPGFGAGMLIRDAATLHPARLARGLRRVLVERGVRIHERSPVRRFAVARPAVAETDGGLVRAERAVVALGAWATPWHAYRPYLTVRGSYIVLTAPAPESVDALGWTGGEAIRDFRSSIHYLRTTPDGRIAFGMGGLQPDLARSIDPRFAFDAPSLRRVADDLHAMFPSFRDVPLEAGWGGPINVAALNLPFFGTLKPGNVHHGLGYTGNGVAPSHMGGKILASLTLGIEDIYTRLPLARRRPKRFPVEPIRTVGMFVANRAIVRKDDLETGGREVDRFTRLVASMPRRLGFHLGPR